jgi:TolB protein
MKRHSAFGLAVQRLGLLGLVILLAGVAVVPTAAAQDGGPPQLTVLAPALNIRSGPDVSYPPFETLSQGRTVGIIGYNAQTGWWQVVSSYGSPGWVSGDAALVAVNEAAILRFVSPQPQGASAVVPTVAPANIIIFRAASGGPIYAINADGSNLRYLTTGLDPALSPDGRWVAFSRWETSQDGALGSLWLINLDGTGERAVMTNVYNPRTPTWSVDGRQLVISFQNGGRPGFERKCSGQRPPRDAVDIDINRDGRDDIIYCFTQLPDPHWSLRLVNVATGVHQDLPGDLYSLSPAWDPRNSQRLIYDGEAGLVNLDLLENKTSALTLDVNDHSPVFSPDGSKIALSYRQDDHWDIHVLNADGSGRLRLTESSYLTWVQQELNGQMPRSYNNAAPAWSPDSSQIAFLTDRTGQWEIWVMNIDGSNQRPLFPPGSLADIPLQYNGVDERVISWR